MKTVSKIMLILCCGVTAMLIAADNVFAQDAEACATGQCVCADIPGGSAVYEWQSNNCNKVTASSPHNPGCGGYWYRVVGTTTQDQFTECYTANNECRCPTACGGWSNSSGDDFCKRVNVGETGCSGKCTYKKVDPTPTPVIEGTGGDDGSLAGAPNYIYSGCEWDDGANK